MFGTKDVQLMGILLHRIENWTQDVGSMKQNVIRFFLLGAASMLLSSCAILNAILQIPGAILKSGVAPVKVVDAPTLENTKKEPLGNDAREERMPVVRN